MSYRYGMGGFTPHSIFHLLIMVIVISLIFHFIGLMGIIIIALALGVYLYVWPKLKRRWQSRYVHKSNTSRSEFIDFD